MTAFIAVAADLLVAVLLVAAISTSLKLSGRLRALKADEVAMRTTIRELVLATETAERAIGSLRQAVQDSERSLGDRLGAAARHAARLEEQVVAGEAVLDRVARVADLSRRTAAEAGVAPPAGGPDRDSGLRAAIAAAREVALRSADLRSGGRLQGRAA